MALVTGSANVSLDTSSGMFAPKLSGLLAGEALHAGVPCYVKSDGLVYECLGPTGTSASAAPFGVPARAVNSGEPVTLFGEGAIFQFSSGLTPGQVLYINKTVAGAYDSAATMADNFGVAVAITAKDIKITRADGKGRS